MTDKPDPDIGESDMNYIYVTQISTRLRSGPPAIVVLVYNRRILE